MAIYKLEVENGDVKCSEIFTQTERGGSYYDLLDGHELFLTAEFLDTQSKAVNNLQKKLNTIYEGQNIGDLFPDTDDTDKTN